MEPATASQTCAPGDVVLHLDRPLVHVTKYEHRLFTCDRCVKKVNSCVLCSRCQKVYYCSKHCENEAWSDIHHLECPILSRHKPLQFENQGIDYMQRLTLRLYLLMIHKNGELRKRPFQLHNGTTRTLDEMEYHPTQLKNSEQFQGIQNYFKLYKILDYDLDLLLRAYGILHVNSFGIDCYQPDGSMEHRGTGLYLEASIFDHSCTPNACASGDGLQLEIRALAPIKAGELIYIDYLQDMLPREQRQQLLNQRYFFTCQCSHRCNSEDHIDFKKFLVTNNLIELILAKPEKEINWTQLYQLMYQRLEMQEKYYSCHYRYHPCLSLFYQSFLKFLILHHIELRNVEETLHMITNKAKEHLAITHGKNHQFYQVALGQYTT